MSEPKRQEMRRDDQEFLPAALEILERPASPLGKGLLYFVVVIAVVALLWSWFSKTDIVAVGSGKVQPAGRVKTIQVSEIGRVSRILVRNGQQVKAGEAIAEVEPTDALADQQVMDAMVFSGRAEIIRRQRATLMARDPGLGAAALRWPQDIPEEFRLLQERLLADEVGTLQAQLATLQAQKQQKEAELAKHRTVVAAQEQLLQLLRERVQMRTDLVQQQDVSRAQLIEAQEALAQQTTAYASQQGSIAEAQQAIAVLERELHKTRQAFIAEHVTKMAEAEKMLKEASSRQTKANLRVERTVLRSPVDGVLHGSSLTSVGQVLTPGQEVARIVPDAHELEIEVYLPNKDIGFISVGQSAAIKVESFPFTRYGVLPATVMHVARDAIPEPDARQIEADPTRAASKLEIAGAQRVQSLVFPVTLRTTVSSMTVDGKSVPLTPGMTVTAEIKTGYRRVLEYLFTPLVDVTSRSIRER